LGGEEYAKKIYANLLKNGVEVLWDDRQVLPDKICRQRLNWLTNSLISLQAHQDQIEWQQELKKNQN
jgi:hypothetical protein